MVSINVDKDICFRKTTRNLDFVNKHDIEVLKQNVKNL